MSNTFELAIEEATNAANAAGDKWMQEHSQPAFIVTDGCNAVGRMLDVCGFAHVTLKDKRTSFAKWLIKKEGSRHVYSVPINHKYRGRQEWGLNEACAFAAHKTLLSYGIKGIGVYSRID